jgi:hypothetical protein
MFSVTTVLIERELRSIRKVASPRHRLAAVGNPNDSQRVREVIRHKCAN